ncbi:1,2-phenylacetyl-CoA epoxidase subunit PaaE [Aurantiacibacter sediminis]|uniref:Phenylacetate-CoA oxygenase/reductase subunit PaaK n=1 Tax=Aurantiacibacter sediminis TaxID=2793064 RepID=A0ABS0N6J7_9SPHN|nr:1,2-phenylacetyl-CoA epoxidase subunit PaaE [Aurantiacibacter sediminis]MBH5323448.1 phenylacetate-CoA oxygenase/reductase subunit PaaK [Aurantiacibacter sediminis]
MPAGFHPLEIAEVRREIRDAVSLRFQVPDELAEAFRYTPGQHITLRATIDGEDVRRNYSICTAPQDKELRVAIKRVAGGQFSTWANTELTPGQMLDVMVPHGSFTWQFDPSASRQYAAFAGGSGITPILSLVKTALATEPDSRFVLLYGNRSSDSVMFLEEIAELKNYFMGRFQCFHFLEDEESSVELFNGRLDAEKIGEILSSIVEPESIDVAFICGPGPMMDAAESGLLGAGVPEDKILIERFTVGKMSAEQLQVARELEQSAAGKPVVLTIDGRKRKITFDPSKETILENARAAGVPAPYACKAGVCATCRAKVRKGEVKMLQNYGLSPEEVEQGYVLTCQAVPVSDEVELDFDA